MATAGPTVATLHKHRRGQNVSDKTSAAIGIRLTVFRGGQIPNNLRAG
jgi:hypothetical protein